MPAGAIQVLRRSCVVRPLDRPKRALDHGHDLGLPHRGGEWSFHQADPGGNSYDFYGSFHEIRSNKLIAQTFTFAGFPDGVALERLTFDDLGDDRTRLTATSLVDSFEARDAMIGSGMERGVREGYDKLDAVLAADTGTDT